MENFLIPRRFVRIKALQNLYGYTIAQKVHQQEAIEQIKKDFTFDSFLDAPDQKDKRVNAQSIAVAIFSEAVATALPIQDFAYAADKQIEQSVHRQLVHYVAALSKDQTRIQNGFNQSKETLYRSLLYTLQLLVAWYKWAKEIKGAQDQSEPATHLLTHQLAQDPLLEALCNNSNWIDAITKNSVNWTKDPYQIENWYRQFIQPAAIPKAYRSTPYNSVKLLEYILQAIIFQEGPMNDCLAMADLYWDEHKRIVKKMLIHVVIMHATKDFTAFTRFWHHPKWALEAAFYNRLLTMVMQNSTRYEAMISEATKKWDNDRILLTDKLILKLALAELLECKDIPFKVSINEYIEIAKWYGTTKSGCFINGVLEGILKGVENQ
ncbi:transcription antitermination factor NusB [Candidatus Cardinium sp. TP]|uniref:transcription antitermination factor NusB n=1 Tax=Candidatus Cardinium sp. TP TaxID=2961955 RepID=UPI0021AED6A9|nr:transcription antitermination factor NusB [Candidatus Cardinium sp. TP]MCT4697248.1 transcription antitermination factor NusB [Candidatus Cardinium sp. TP]MDN5247233.1 transcription antitermination factor NusB [Candidatus Cardinium sp.]